MASRETDRRRSFDPRSYTDSVSGGGEGESSMDAQEGEKIPWESMRFGRGMGVDAFRAEEEGRGESFRWSRGMVELARGGEAIMLRRWIDGFLLSEGRDVVD